MPCAETAELILASGATELWQHPGHVGPDESQSLLAINSMSSRNTKEVSCCPSVAFGQGSCAPLWCEVQS